jgi:hypothetical protein
LRNEPAPGPALPLARWADRQLRLLTEETGSERIARLDGSTILGERGSNNGFVISGRVSAGPGGSRLLRTRDGGWFALTLLRAEDRELLPALFLGEALDINDNAAIASAVARHDCADLLSRGRDLGLPVASADETPASPPVSVIAAGPHRRRESGALPLVIDLSAIWAGPLAGHLLWLAGAEVVKIESPRRPDLIRRDDPSTFDLINQGKANVAIDLSNEAERRALVELIRRADMVIESSRPRALVQLGVDADSLVRETPGLVWLSVTGHGATGEPANWAGIGHDCGVAAGLGRALAEAAGEIGYVGDAVADPLTGITAAIEGWRAFRAGDARRIGFAMSAIAARALAEERAHDPVTLEAELRGWGAALGQPFPKLPRRPLLAEVRPLGVDTRNYLPAIPPC